MLNEADYDVHFLDTIPKVKVCACGCHGRHTIDAMLGIFDWSMKIMLGGVRPFTNREIQPLDAPRLVPSPQ